MRRIGGDIAIVKDNLSAACRNPARQHADKGCLASPVWPDQGAYLAGGKVKINILHGFKATEMPAEIACGQQAHGSHRIVRRRNSPTSPCGANRVSATSTRPAISI